MPDLARRSSRRAAALAALALAATLGGCAGRSATRTATPTATSTSTPTATSTSTSTRTATSTAVPPGALAPVPSPTKTAVLPPGSAFAAIHAGLEGASSDDCLGCHAELHPRIAVHGSHPVGLDLAAASAAHPDRYRTLEAVRGAGLPLPGGRIACLTCHDLAAPWAHRVLLPAGAAARPAVVLGDPSTYGDELGSGDAAPRAALAPGAAISAKPLCESCHRF